MKPATIEATQTKFHKDQVIHASATSICSSSINKNIVTRRNERVEDNCLHRGRRMFLALRDRSGTVVNTFICSMKSMVDFNTCQCGRDRVCVESFSLKRLLSTRTRTLPKARSTSSPHQTVNSSGFQHQGLGDRPCSFFRAWSECT